MKSGQVHPIDSNHYLQGAAAPVLGNTGNLLMSGYAFAGWDTMADGSGTGYGAGAAFSMGTANITLFAVWISNNFTFTSSP